MPIAIYEESLGQVGGKGDIMLIEGGLKVFRLIVDFDDLILAAVVEITNLPMVARRGKRLIFCRRKLIPA